MKTYRECVIEVLTKHDLAYLYCENPEYPNSFFINIDSEYTLMRDSKFWDELYIETENLYGDYNIPLTEKLRVYEELLYIFGSDSGRRGRLGICNQISELAPRYELELPKRLDIRHFRELCISKKSPSVFWWPLVDGVDENRCNAIREAIKLVNDKIKQDEDL